MGIFEFYGNAIKSHKKANTEILENISKFDINRLTKRDQFKTINEVSGFKGVTSWASRKGSLNIRSTYTAATRSVQTVFKLHNNIIFKWSELRGYAIVLGDSKLWQSATTKRHINYLLRLLFINFKYVTINNKPYLLGANGSTRKRLELNNTYYLNDL